MKVLISGVGYPHNEYTGVDGGSNIRIPLAHRLTDMGHDVYWNQIDSPPSPHSVDNPILRGLGYYTLKNMFTECMPAIHVNIPQAMELDFDVAIIELRPNSGNLRYNFKEQHRKIMELGKKLLSKGTRVILWDQDGWYDDYLHLIGLGASIGYSYAKPPLLNPLGHDMHHLEFFSWEPKRYKKAIKLLAQQVLNTWDVMYTGNVYGRGKYMEETLKYLPNHAITGNWLRTSDIDRVKRMVNSYFIGQSDHWLTIPLMSQSKVSLVYGNDTHLKNGMIAVRIFEAHVARTPLMIHKEFYRFRNNPYPMSLPKFSHAGDIQKLTANETLLEDAMIATDEFVESLGDPRDDIKWMLGI